MGKKLEIAFWHAYELLLRSIFSPIEQELKKKWFSAE